MALKLMGKKRGMVQLFDESGQIVVCTIIEAEPNVVTQLKTKDTDGYEAIQLGYEEVTAKDPRRKKTRVVRPQAGHYEKIQVAPRKHLAESKVENQGDFSLGQEITVGFFSDVPYVDVSGRSKGKGYQGVMKKYNFAGGPAAHGSGFHRHAGSTGQRTTPGRCFRNGPRASHMGAESVTVQNLRLVQIIEKENLILVEGAIPGANGDLVTVRESVKKPKSTKSSGVKLWQH